LKVIAEGVETRQAREMLTEFGCDQAQGYFFSYPLLPREITRMLYNSTRSADREAPGSTDISIAVDHVPQVPPLSHPTLYQCK
jgi:predicted signal transduction protein with EAL and GGDEF domain